MTHMYENMHRPIGHQHIKRTNMSEFNGSGCTPDKCGGCTGCGGDVIDKFVLRVEWKHKGETPEDPEAISRILHDLSGELMVSGVELIYINNTYEENIENNSSTFFINGHPLSGIVDLPEGLVSKELIRKGIFQALLQNI